MDLNDLKIALPSIPTFESPLPKYTFRRPYPQSFSVSYPIIKYMIQNPQSGKVWKKLIMCCKYFYSKYPVFPFQCLEVICDLKCKADGEYFDSSLTFPKLWIYDTMCAAKEPNVVRCLLPKIFKYDLRLLEMSRQRLTMKEYQKLTSSGSVEQILLDECTIMNDDRTHVTMDKLLEDLQDLETFEFVCSMFDTSVFQHGTVEKMVQHLNGFTNMRYFIVSGLTERFNFVPFSVFLLKNKNVHVKLFYRRGITDAYKEMVKNVVEEIKKDPALKIPVINFFN